MDLEIDLSQTEKDDPWLSLGNLPAEEGTREKSRERKYQAFKKDVRKILSRPAPADNANHGTTQENGNEIKPQTYRSRRFGRSSLGL
jgi:hypothetical protein